MQDIVFYVAANETLGKVRDYSNMRSSAAPLLTLGVAVCLRMRLFDDVEVSTPYPIASFDGITEWQWSMDADFDRSTVCKLVADADGVSVHSVNDTVNGETMNFTEFVIRISNMNTENLAAWLGNEGTKSGLTGELVGYDNGGHAVFVLQIEDFSVRNRVAGLGDPTALDQENVTRTQAGQMIQTAVSALAVTKQDKLTSANAGTGISISSEGVISTANVPQSAVSGLSASLAAKQNSITAGYRMALVSGSTVEQARYFAIEPAITALANRTTTVVLSAGKAFEIHAVANNATVLLNREEPPFARTFGLEGHMELFVANTGYVQTGANVVLANALEPDAVNNCTLRFHDGKCIISVEDHIAGYIVTVNANLGSGTLYDGIDSGNEYIAFDASLNGQTLNLNDVETPSSGETHIVGNGYAETIISGGITINNSKTTVANLSLQNVAVNGGMMTLGDVFIPSGSTVAVSGGGIAIEKVTGNGTVDLGGSHIVVPYGNSINAASVTITSGGANNVNGGGISNAGGGGVATITNVSFIGNNGSYGGGLGNLYNNASANVSNGTFSGCNAIRGGGMCNVTANANVSSCTFSGCRATQYGGGIYCGSGAMTITECSITGNSASLNGGGICLNDTASVTLSNCIVSGNNAQNAGKDCYLLNSATRLILAGANVVGDCSGSGSVTLTSGAILDLTGNTNATPVAPGVGITFTSGGATVKVGSGTASSSYMMDNVTLPAGAKLTNTAAVDLGGTNVVVSSGTTANVSGCTFSGGIASNGGALKIQEANATLSGVTITGNTGTTTGGGIELITADATLIDCLVSGNSASNVSRGKDIYMRGAASLVVSGGTIGTVAVGGGTMYVSGAVSLDLVMPGVNASGAAEIASGATLDLSGNTNAAPIAPGGGVVVDGGCTVINSAGTSVSIAGGTYTKINNDGTTE